MANDKNLIITVPFGDICDNELHIIVNGIAYDIVTDAMEDIFDACIKHRDALTVPKNAYGVTVKLSNLRYVYSQGGAYPPPNIEFQGYWEFDIKTERFNLLPENLGSSEVPF